MLKGVCVCVWVGGEVRVADTRLPHAEGLVLATGHVLRYSLLFPDEDR